MNCTNCDCELTQAEADEVIDIYGLGYTGRCLDCAMTDWHDANEAPEDCDE